MGRFFYTYKLHRVRTIFFLLLLLVNGSVWADDNCPTLETKTLLLCNPTDEEVAENLGTPVTLINGERAEGYLTLDKDFYYTKNTTEYTAIWTFKNDEGTVLADGCEQKFYVQDNESPVEGDKTLTVYGLGGYLEGAGFKSQVRNQTITWSDNCTTSDSINVDFTFSGIEDNDNLTGGTKDVTITLTDRNGNIPTVYTQKVKIEISLHTPHCPKIKDIYLTGCGIDCSTFKSEVQTKSKANSPVMDGFGVNVDVYPESSNGVYNLFADANGTAYSCNGKSFYPGEYTIYLKFRQMNNDNVFEWWHKYCPQKVIVKDAGTPPDCPTLKTLINDASSISASEIEELIEDKVHSYTDKQLDNCSPNTSLSVTYTGSALNAPYCGDVTYYLSDYGTKRSCKATIALPECPNLPQRTKKFCSWRGLSKDELITFLNSDKPILQFCDETITGTLVKNNLNNNYRNSTTITVNWNFYKDEEIVKSCTQQIVLQIDDNKTCSSKNFELEANQNCEGSGESITVPILNGCYDTGSRVDYWSKDNSNWKDFSSLKNATFKNNETLYWKVTSWGDTYCQCTIKVVDKTKPSCANPSVSIESCSVSRGDVESKLGTVVLGNDNCGISSSSIDWDRTAYSEFKPAIDGSEKNYKIYYSVTDINGLTNDGYCLATLTVKSKPVPCPDEKIGMLSTDGSFSVTLSDDYEWNVVSPSSVSVSGNTLTGTLPFNTMTEVKLSTKVCGQTKECATNITLIKSATPCSTSE